MNTQNLLILALGIAGGALILSLLSLYLIWKQERVRKNFYAGDQPVSLEQILSSQATQLKNLQADQNNLLEELQRVSFNTNFAVQKMGMVRFNTFGDSGGNLSFTLALLDSENSGVILTSMFGREQNRIYSKPIQKGKSEFTLTDEEQKAIKGAIQDWKNKIAPSKLNKKREQPENH